jgi:membrane-associated phospholipid phosphatase
MVMQNILETIAKLGISLDSPYLYAVVILLGLMFSKNKAMFGRTLLLVTFTMIYNLGLKSIWKIPLPEPLTGWAFPSGHMHAAVVFYGWLAIEMHKTWFTEIALFILCIIAYGLLYCGYHWPIDILGSIIFGSFTLFTFWLINRQSYFQQKPYRVGYILSALAIIIYALVYPYFGHILDIKLILGILLLTAVSFSFKFFL